jgi:RNase P subunit RPR2
VDLLRKSYPSLVGFSTSQNMEIYEPLPVNLKCSFKDGIQPAVRQQLEYLWRGAHIVSSSSSLAHSLCIKFIDLAMKSGLQIPEQVRNRFCSHCSGILLPTITSKVRVQSRGKQSKIHKKKKLIPRGDNNVNDETDDIDIVDSKIRRKLKNQVVRVVYIFYLTYFLIVNSAVWKIFECYSRIIAFLTSSQITICKLCNHTSRVVSGCERSAKSMAPKRKLASVPGEVSNDSIETHHVLQNVVEPSIQNQNSAKKYSFLQKGDRRSSAPGRMAEDFIPLSATGSSNVDSKSGSSFFQKAARMKSSSSSFMSIIDSKVPLTAELSLKLGIVCTDMGDDESFSGQKRPLTLLEMEEKNKKEKKARRKTNEFRDTPNKRVGIAPTVGYELNTTGSLSSLQNVFKVKK